MDNYRTPGVYIKEIPSFPPSVVQVATAIPAFIGYTENMPIETVTLAFTAKKTASAAQTFELDPVPVSVSDIGDVEIIGFDASKLTLSNNTLSLKTSDFPSDDTDFTVSYEAYVIKPIRISSMLEYEKVFGKNPKQAAFSVRVSTDSTTGISSIEKVKITSTDSFILYYCLQLFFANGGSACYVVSVGSYTNDTSYTDNELKDKNAFIKGLGEIKKKDEPTLLIIADALSLGEIAYKDVCDTALIQCADLQDRFTIMDVGINDRDASKFRAMSLTNLSYGAAYTPHLISSLSYQYNEDYVSVSNIPKPKQWTAQISLLSDTANIDALFDADETTSPGPKVSLAFNSDATIKTISIPAPTSNELTITLPQYAAASGGTAAQGANLKQIQDFWTNNVTAADKDKFSLSFRGDMTSLIQTIPSGADSTTLNTPPGTTTMALSAMKDTETAIYNLVKAKLNSQYITLPSSPAMAGIYARVDGSRGVWKAPANVVVSSIIGPSYIISDADQAYLNVDATSGKSINVIRTFTGKGTLVWGARTLDGNSNDWRYINVRRLFITIEESVQKASAFAVFEPNDATTWLKVKAMIDNYLYGLWQQGALAGPKPESAYYVNIGLGKTMTNEDILNGIMNVEIGIAAVRPAEFIVLKFSQKMQEA